MVLAGLISLACLQATAQPAATAGGGGQALPADHIVAVVNRELVTAVEVERGVAQARAQAAASGARLPEAEALRRQVLESLIEERAVLTHAREAAGRIDEAEIDRAVASIAARNGLDIAQLRERLAQEGLDLQRLRANVRDQLAVERTREREVGARINVTEAEIDQWLAQRREQALAQRDLNLAQILISVPESADPALLQQRRERAEQALSRLRAGEAFEQVAREMSDSADRERGGVLGPRPAARLPDLFVAAVRGLQPGEVTPVPVRSGAGFHVLKVVGLGEVPQDRIVQTLARHILVRPSARQSVQEVSARLAEFQSLIRQGRRRFEDLARDFSEDGSAAQGGDLGWLSPGATVPEFEQAMDALPVGGLSDPVVSRFGVHLIEVVQRREVPVDPRVLREQARNVLRGEKFESAYAEWVRELRSRAYVELRDAPL
ncbi:MAG: chaperone/peptidyl-prolyl cis-trans isomerase SurA [Pseudomonadota bacterium]